MESAANDRLLGDYRLKELVAENTLTRTWLAEQTSVARRVLVDELRPEQVAQREAFLADVRAKAAVEHPLIGSVYEAVAEPELCFFAYELLAGATFADRLAAAAPFKPARFVHLLRRIAEAHLQYEALNQATAPLRLEHIHVDDQGVIRLVNLAVAGSHQAGQVARDIHYLGESLRPLVADSQSGSTRVLTLLRWMSGEEVAEPLDWVQVRDLCNQIELQLADPLPPASPTRPAVAARKNQAMVAILLAVAVLLGAGLVLLPRFRHKPAPAPPRNNLPADIVIAAGKHPTPDGTEEALQAFRIAGHEVTIGQYAEFVDTLETLAKDHRERTFDHENQPPEKIAHLPDDWAALLAAAKSNGMWNQHAVTLDSPVVGVDWWDCAAYAEWKQMRLATQEEWFAALCKDLPDPAKLTPGAYLPVTAITSDRTLAGMTGMAGSVCEWTRRPAVNPANPLGQRMWVIIGGSYLKPGSNALTREWTDNRSLRRPDLGFRIVGDAD